MKMHSAHDNISVGQYSRYSRTRHHRNIYSFCLYIDGRLRTLSDIDEVIYALDPSFPDPIRRQWNASNCFAIESEAWGEFGNTIDIRWRSGRVQTIHYELRLYNKGWKLGGVPENFESSTERMVYESLFDPKFEWRKVSTIARRCDLHVDDTVRMLDGLGQKKAARKAYFQSIDKEDLWGATAIVGLLPEPKP